MALHVLPDELLLLVLQQLESTADLAKVALCSRHIHDLALPPPYSRFSDEGGALLRTPLFLSTVVRRPDLAKYVQKFSIKAQKFSLLAPGSFDENWYGIEAVLKRVCEDENRLRRWYHDLHHSIDAIIALALLLLPNI